jgi:diamine N-acetyltransferase
MEKILIRKAGLNDLAQLQTISKRTFLEAFTAGNKEEDLKKYIEKSFSAEKLAEELNNKNSEFYLASLNNDTIGYLKLNFGPAQTELKEDKAIEIERIYVLSAFYGRNAGQALYQKVIEIATVLSASYVWLGVWEKNPRAISFYKKNGFVAFDKHVFKLGDDEQIDIMMKLEVTV